MSSAFGTVMTVIIVLYVAYYFYNIIRDLYFDKSGDVVKEVAVDEKEVDISDELKDFTKFDANEDEKIEQEAQAKLDEKDASDDAPVVHPMSSGDGDGQGGQESSEEDHSRYMPGSSDEEDNGEDDNSGDSDESDNSDEGSVAQDESAEGKDDETADGSENLAESDDTEGQEQEGKEVEDGDKPTFIDSDVPGDDYISEDDEIQFDEVKKAFSGLMKNIPQEPAMTGSISAELWERLDDADFDNLDIVIRRCRAAA